MSDVKDISQVAAEGSSELQNYSNAQFKVIKDLQAKISKLESEKESLMILLEQNVPMIQDTSDLGLGISNEQLICEVQIKLLKDQAVSGRQLTMEEAKKVQIFSEILSKVRTARPDPDAIKVESFSDADLVKLVNN